ncbi:MAG: hypothetical protein ACP5SH_24065 [Syntrophobacteraceae bacterium]
MKTDRGNFRLIMGVHERNYFIPGHFSDISRNVGMGTHPPRQVCAEGSLAVMIGSNRVQYMPSTFCMHLVACSGQSDAAGPTQRVPVEAKAPNARMETRHISFFMGKLLQKQYRAKSGGKPPAKSLAGGCGLQRNLARL